jgi:hypothetical protein
VNIHKVSDTKTGWTAYELTTFDGPTDDFDFFPIDKQSNNINNTSTERSSAPPRFNPSMDGDQGHARLPATSSSSAWVKSLHARKVLSQTHIERSQPSLNNHDFYQNISETPVYPPRASSTRSHPSYCDPVPSQPQATRTKTPYPPLNSEQPSIATGSQGTYHTFKSTDARFTASNPGRLTVSRKKSRYLSDSSSAIIGDFVPIDSPNMAGLQSDMSPSHDSFQR